ncbi:MAG: hypothetical protein HY904_08450 [Deltaproteobacteria bacterium]|nr:hypothetical protein [Deltaproteobacteria bacterium]
MTGLAWCLGISACFYIGPSGVFSRKDAVLSDRDVETLPLKALQGHKVKVSVKDKRKDKDHSKDVVAGVEDALRRHLEAAGVAVDDDGDIRLSVHVREFSAAISQVVTTWTACVELSATVAGRTGEQGWKTSGRKCVERASVLGQTDGEAALREAYKKAMAKLMDNLDAAEGLEESLGRRD